MESPCRVESLVLEGRFELEFLAEGGMSAIYQGVDRSTGREVMVKMAPASDLELASTLIREHETLIRLDHPGLVRSLGLVRHEGNVYLVLEKVQGRDLAEVLRLGDLQVDECLAVDWARQLTEVIRYLHAQSPPVVFRDLKPSNIVLGPDGRLVLIDFGAARVRTSGVLGTVPLGTPGYAPPEQYASHGGTADERTDLYSLGVTVYQMLVRREPVDFCFRFPRPAELGVTVSPAFEKILMRAIDPDPARRYQSATALLRDLGRGRWRPTGPTWSATAAGLLFMAALAGALAALPADVLNGYFRRVSLELGAAGVPLEATIAARWALGACLVIMGLLVSRALRTRRGWLALAAFLLFMVGACVPMALRVAQRDGAAGIPIDTSSPSWDVASDMPSDQQWGFGLISMSESGETWLMTRQSPTRFAVVDGRTGTVAWTGESIARHNLFRDGRVVQVKGDVLTLRAARDGKVLAEHRASEPIATLTWVPRGSFLLYLESGRIEAAHLPLPSTSLPAHVGGEALQNLVVDVNQRTDELQGIHTQTGRVAWKRAVAHGIPHHLMSIGDTTAWITSEGVEGLDTATGTTRFRFALPSDGPGAESFEAIRVYHVDSTHMMVQRGRWIHRIGIPDGAVQWKVRVPDARVQVRMCSPSTFSLFTGDGKLMGIQGSTGLVTWESWTGTPWQHLWPPSCSGFEWVERVGSVLLVQQRGSSILRALEPASGRVVWQRAMPDGFRVSRLVDDGVHYFCLGSDRDGKVRMMAIRRPDLRPESATSLH